MPQPLDAEYPEFEGGTRGVAAWFHRFYDLRNAIVHGDKVPRAKFIFDAGTRKLPQLAVADLVLWEVISWELFGKKLVGDKSRKYANWLSKKVG